MPAAHPAQAIRNTANSQLGPVKTGSTYQHHAEPTRTGLEAEFPRWRITDRTVDRRAWAQLRDDPATAVRGEDLMDLRDEIRRAEALME